MRLNPRKQRAFGHQLIVVVVRSIKCFRYFLPKAATTFIELLSRELVARSDEPLEIRRNLVE